MPPASAAHAALPSVSAAEAAPAVGAVTARRWRLGVIFISHTVIDTLSMVVVPLLSVIEGRVGITPVQGAALIGIGSICSGLIQPIAAWMGDRYNTRIFGPAGLVLAGLSIGMLGFAQNYAHLVVLQALTTLGIGAFHPVAAAAAGQLAGAYRSAGIAIFFTFGMIGHVTGSILSPALVERAGMTALMWFMVPAFLTAALLAAAIGRFDHRTAGATERLTLAGRDDVRRRWWAVGVLYVGNVLRFTVNMALITLIVRWAEMVTLQREGLESLTPALREAASILNGNHQAALTVGMAVGGLTGGLIATPGREKAVLFGTTLVGIPAIIAFPFAAMWLAPLLAVAAGIGFASATPLSIALAQRLLPHRTGLASGLMLGGAWMFAATGPALAQVLTDHFGLAVAFAAVAGLLAVAGGLTVFLRSSLLREAL